MIYALRCLKFLTQPRSQNFSFPSPAEKPSLGQPWSRALVTKAGGEEKRKQDEKRRGKGRREKIEEIRLFPKNCCLKKLDNEGKLNIALSSKSLLLTPGNTQRKEKSGLIRFYDWSTLLLRSQERINEKNCVPKSFLPLPRYVMYLDGLEMYWILNQSSVIGEKWICLQIWSPFWLLHKIRDCYRQRENVDNLCTTLKCKSSALAGKTVWCSFNVGCLGRPCRHFGPVSLSL